MVRIGMCQQSQIDTIPHRQFGSDQLSPIPGANVKARIDTYVIKFPLENGTAETLVSGAKGKILTYNVDTTGYYCMWYAIYDQQGGDGDMPWVSIQQPYGRLVADRYGYLVFYGVISLIYLVVAVVWLGFTALYWREILPVQNWIAGVLFVLLLDNAVSYWFYDYWNAHEDFSMVLLILMVIFNSLRNAISLFCLLILSMGYGVVKPHLGDQMKHCMALGVFLFISFVLFDLGALFIPPDEDGAASFFFFILPLALALSFTFAKVDKSLQETLKHLVERRQTYKLSMYTWLRRVILGFIISAIFLTLIISIAVLRWAGNREWYSNNWQGLWFWREGWMTLLYMAAFFAVASLWRPTANNARYGLEELPSDQATADNFDLQTMPATNAQGEYRRRNTQNHTVGSPEVVFDMGGDTDSESPQPRQTNTTDSPPTRQQVYALSSDDEENAILDSKLQ